MKRTPIKRRTPVRKRNPKRHSREWLRAYGGKERAEWVKRLPCFVCGRMGDWTSDFLNENAHIESGGQSRKADYDKIVPACPHHHREMHRYIRTFARKYGINLEQAARDTESRWQASQNINRESE